MLSFYHSLFNDQPPKEKLRGRTFREWKMAELKILASDEGVHVGKRKKKELYLSIIQSDYTRAEQRLSPPLSRLRATIDHCLAFFNGEEWLADDLYELRKKARELNNLKEDISLKSMDVQSAVRELGLFPIPNEDTNCLYMEMMKISSDLSTKMATQKQRQEDMILYLTEYAVAMSTLRCQLLLPPVNFFDTSLEPHELKSAHEKLETAAPHLTQLDLHGRVETCIRLHEYGTAALICLPTSTTRLMKTAATGLLEESRNTLVAFEKANGLAALPLRKVPFGVSLPSAHCPPTRLNLESIDNKQDESDEEETNDGMGRKRRKRRMINQADPTGQSTSAKIRRRRIHLTQSDLAEIEERNRAFDAAIRQNILDADEVELVTDAAKDAPQFVTPANCGLGREEEKEGGRDETRDEVIVVDQLVQGVSGPDIVHRMIPEVGERSALGDLQAIGRSGGRRLGGGGEVGRDGGLGRGDHPLLRHLYGVDPVGEAARRRIEMDDEISRKRCEMETVDERNRQIDEREEGELSEDEDDMPDLPPPKTSRVIGFDGNSSLDPQCANSRDQAIPKIILNCLDKRCPHTAVDRRKWKKHSLKHSGTGIRCSKCTYRASTPQDADQHSELHRLAESVVDLE